MGGGNARQRRTINRMLRKLRGITIVQQSPEPLTVVPEGKAIWLRLLDFAEQPLFLWAMGILAGLVGLFIFTPLLTVCGICILLAFHRANVVRGATTKVQAISYGLLILLTGAILLGTRYLIKENLPHIPTASEIADYILKRLPRQTAGPEPVTPTEHAAGPSPEPFSVAVEVRIISPGSGTFSGFWVQSGDQQNCVLIPIDDLLFLRVTNAQPIPKTVIDYAVEDKIDGRWHLLKRLNLAAGYAIWASNTKGPSSSSRVGAVVNFPSFADSTYMVHFPAFVDPAYLVQSAVVEFPSFDALIGGRTLAQGETVRGWSGFQYSQRIGKEVRVRITDELGKTYTVAAITPKGDETVEGVAPHTMTISGYSDTSRCTQKPDFVRGP